MAEIEHVGGLQFRRTIIIKIGPTKAILAIARMLQLWPRRLLSFLARGYRCALAGLLYQLVDVFLTAGGLLTIRLLVEYVLLIHYSNCLQLRSKYFLFFLKIYLFVNMYDRQNN